MAAATAASSNHCEHVFPRLAQVSDRVNEGVTVFDDLPPQVTAHFLRKRCHYHCHDTGDSWCFTLKGTARNENAQSEEIERQG